MRQFKKSSTIFVLAAIGVISTFAELAHASLKYTAPQLIMKKYEEMVDLTQKELKHKYELDDELSEQKEQFKEALKVILAKPDTNDGVRRLIFSDIRNQMEDLEIGIFKEVITESVTALKASDSVDQKVAYTYVVVLENLMEELKPRAAEYKTIFEQIKNAHIEFTDDLKSFVARNSKSRGKALTPSVIAESILSQH